MSTFEKQDTFEKVANIIAEKLSIEKEAVKNEATLESLGADSLDVVELIMRFEDQFGVEIDDEMAEKLKNVEGVVTYIHEQRTK